MRDFEMFIASVSPIEATESSSKRVRKKSLSVSYFSQLYIIVTEKK